MDIDQRLVALLAGLPRLMPGHVWLVGAGPGDPGYLTLHAVSALAQADVIVHDALIDDRVAALARPDARLEPAGKRGHQPSAEQAAISARLVELARAGERIVRLKGGDPFVFGRAGEEMLALAGAGIPFRIVSGVTAGLAGAAAALIPPTLRGINQAVIFATGHGAGDGPRIDWASLAATGQPLVIYMAMHQLDGIAADLLAGGLAPETPAAVVASATLPDQRILVSRLDRIAAEAGAQGIGPPAVVVVGAVVAMRQRLDDLMRAHATEAPS
ncbi:MAG TPA: uroporphyrinogen-III C-methyltransferase [Bauldia sp.]|nr:uroporphyrinogen-III C-methyltransferase [Bauldia sp.]